MSSALSTALASGLIRPVIFVELHFVSGPVYLFSGAGTISWNSHTWSGLGKLASISTIADGSNVEAKGIVLGCSGLDPTLLSDLLGQVQVGLPVIVYLGVLDSGGAVVADPLTAWSGSMDQPAVMVGADEARITINCEDKLIEMNVPVDRRYTNDDQQIDNPGDTAYSFVNGIQEANIYWGRTPNTAPQIAIYGGG